MCHSSHRNFAKYGEMVNNTSIRRNKQVTNIIILKNIKKLNMWQLLYHDNNIIMNIKKGYFCKILTKLYEDIKVHRDTDFI